VSSKSNFISLASLFKVSLLGGFNRPQPTDNDHHQRQDDRYEFFSP